MGGLLVQARSKGTRKSLAFLVVARVCAERLEVMRPWSYRDEMIDALVLLMRRCKSWVGCRSLCDEDKWFVSEICEHVQSTVNARGFSEEVRKLGLDSTSPATFHYLHVQHLESSSTRDLTNITYTR